MLTKTDLRGLMEIDLITIIPVYVLLSVPTRILLNKFPGCQLSLSVFLFIYSVIASLSLCIYYGEIYYNVSAIAPSVVISIYFPIYVFSIIYGSDFYVFLRCLPIALLSVIPLFLGCIMVGLEFYSIGYTTWSLMTSLISGVACLPIQPFIMVAIFKDLAKYKYLGTMLEAEAIVILIPTTIAFDLILDYIQLASIPRYVIVVSAGFRVLASLINGIVIGKIGGLLMKWVYNDVMPAVAVTISITFISYISANFLIKGCGTLSVISSVCMICLERHRFSVEVDKSISAFWNTAYYFIETTTYIYTITELVKCLYMRFVLSDFYATFITYLTILTVRIIGYIVLLPFAKTISYELNIRCLIILGWCGIKGTVNYLLALTLIRYKETQLNGFEFIPEILVSGFLSLVINSACAKIILQLIGISELSVARKSNMNNCMKYVMEKRNVIIDTLKVDKFLANANWFLVRQETLIEHPYKLKSKEVAEVESLWDDHMNTATTILCPECLKEVQFDISEKDYSDMVKDAKNKILKAKKILVAKHYENGVIGRNSAQIFMRKLDILLYSNLKKNKTMDIMHYLNPDKSKLNRFLLYISKRPKHERPDGKFAGICFTIMTHFTYEYILYAVIIVHVGFMFRTRSYNIYLIVNVTALVVFVAEFVINLYGSSKDGKKAYFKYFWNICHLIFIIFHTIYLITFINFETHDRFIFVVYILHIILVLRVFRIFKLITPLHSILQNCVMSRINNKKSFGYELAMGWIYCCNVTIEMLPQLVEMKLIRTLLIKELTEEKRVLAKAMEDVRKRLPWVAITVKTKQAIRTTLRVMEAALEELKQSGFVDNVEHAFIDNEIYQKQKILRGIKFIQPSSAKTLLHDVPWIGDNEEVFEYLYSHAQKHTWKPGVTVCKEGELSSGIFMAITGMLRISYVGKPVDDSVRYHGKLPIIDFISTLNFNNDSDENIMSGDTFGELSVLTDRVYDCNIYSDCVTEAYLITTEDVREVMRLDSDPITGLEARLWKHATLHLAIAILLDAPIYQSSTQEQLKFKLEKAFVPDLRMYKMFILSELMVDVLLLDGIAADFNKVELYVAPMLIPRTTQKLVLPLSSEINVNHSDDIKLMIIPAMDVDAGDIMQIQNEYAKLNGTAEFRVSMLGIINRDSIESTSLPFWMNTGPHNQKVYHISRNETVIITGADDDSNMQATSISQSMLFQNSQKFGQGSSHYPQDVNGKKASKLSVLSETSRTSTTLIDEKRQNADKLASAIMVDDDSIGTTEFLN